jgi:hypothetical protein
MTTQLSTSTFNLILKLAGMSGHKFIAYKSEIDMLAVNAKGQLTKMNKRGNPWIGKTLVKRSAVQATVGFDYEKKVEKRDGEQPQSKGNWMQAFIYNGKITPLATHKGDIQVDDESKKLADQRAVMDDNGSVIITAAQPRLYLRFEMQRENGEGERQDRKAKSHSEYLTQNDNGAWESVEDSEVTPWLKKSGPRTDETDVQSLSIGNLKELSIDGEKIEII